ncbi:MAG: VOC family protein [Pseudomonadota bacterium]
MASANPKLSTVIGDYDAFFLRQRARLNDRGIDIDGCEISHFAYRTATFDEYLHKRGQIETHCHSNIETVWNGRPISIMQLTSPRGLSEGFRLPTIELIGPVHRRVYPMGLEHVGVVIGPDVDEFSRTHRHALTGQQFQSEECEPYYVTFFEDFSTVKFYDQSLVRICEQQHGRQYEGFHHVADEVRDP